MKKELKKKKNYYEVTMEYIKDTVKVVAEGQKAMGEKIDRDLKEIKEEFRGEFRGVNSNFKTIFDYLSRIDDELKDIRNEMKKMREELKSKTDLVRFEALESRVFKIEEELAHRREVEEIIDFLEIQPIRRAVAGTLGYGLRKRVELARAIALKPDLLLLDEPMAGMHLEEKEDMARFIIDLNEEWNMTVVMIEHDMGVVMDISHRVMVLDFGKRIALGTPEEVRENPHVKRAYLGEEDEVLNAAARAVEAARAAS